jgi:hypothetical protein
VKKGHSSFLSRVAVALIVATVFTGVWHPSSSSATSTRVIPVPAQGLVFANFTDPVSGLAEGATVRFTNVVPAASPEVDAIVTIVDLHQVEATSDSGVLGLNRIDEVSSAPPVTDDSPLDVRIRNMTSVGGTDSDARPDDDETTTADQAFVEFRIDFVEDNTLTPVVLQNLGVNIVDIDNDQFVEAAGFSTFELSSTPATNIQVGRAPAASFLASGGQTFSPTVPAGSASFFASQSSDDPDQDHWVSFTYPDVQTLSFKAGSFVEGSASFLFEFVEADWSVPPVSGTADPVVVSESAVASRPAIHLDLQGRAGQPAARTPVLMEGEALKPGSPYSLTLRQPARTIQSGLANTGGRFSHLMALPADLAPGSYTLTLQAVGVNGESLILTQSVTVGPNGVFTRIGTAVPTVSGGLASTGVSDARVVAGLATAVLLGLAGAALLSLRRGNARSQA